MVLNPGPGPAESNLIPQAHSPWAGQLPTPHSPHAWQSPGTSFLQDRTERTGRQRETKARELAGEGQKHQGERCFSQTPRCFPPSLLILSPAEALELAPGCHVEAGTWSSPQMPLATPANPARWVQEGVSQAVKRLGWTTSREEQLVPAPGGESQGKGRGHTQTC